MLSRVSWLFAGTLLGNLSRFAFGVLLARHLGAADFGRFSLSTLFALSVYTVLGIGLGDTAARYVATALTRRSRGELVQTLRFVSTAGLALGFIGGGVTLLAAGYITENWFDKPELAPYVRALAWTIPAGVAFVCASGVIQAFEAFRALNLVRNVAFPALPLVLWLFIAGRAGTASDAILCWNLALVLSAAAAVTCSALLFRRASAAEAPAQVDSREQARFATSSTIVGLLNVLQSWLETFMLGRLANADSVGRYGAATRLVQPMAMATFSFISVYYPRAASLHASGERVALRALHQDTARWTAITTAVAYIGLVALGGPLLTLFGEEFAPAWPALVLYASGQMVLAVTGPSAQLLMMTGKQNGVVFATALGVSASGLLAWLLIPTLGAAGAGAAFLAGMSAYSISAMLQVRRVHGYWPWARRTAWVAATMASSAPVAAALHLTLPKLPLIIAGSALVAVTASVLFHVGLTNDERQQLRGKLPWQSRRHSTG